MTCRYQYKFLLLNRCYACHNQLIPGDSFVCNEDGSIYCITDYERIFNNSADDNSIIGKSFGSFNKSSFN